MISLGLLDAAGQETYEHSSSVYYLTRLMEGPPDGATPMHKVTLVSREELLAHSPALLPNNTLTLVAKMVFVQEVVQVYNAQFHVFATKKNFRTQPTSSWACRATHSPATCGTLSRATTSPT
jgi:hypothetical protein